MLRLRGLHLTPGVRVLNRYQIEHLVGEGGMGRVYRAYDSLLGQTVALKFLGEALTNNETALARLHSEVRIARQVSHPNICRVHDIGEAEGISFLSMEYVEGENLGSFLKRLGPPTPHRAHEIARQLCAGLAAVHELGVLHCDLKPGNILIDHDGKVRITDFGLSRLEAELPQTKSSGGTPAYMSPEQLAGGGATKQSDIYSLGLVLYELFTGKRAFDVFRSPPSPPTGSRTAPIPPSELIKGIYPPYEHVILQCLETEPQKRPASVPEIAEMLEADPSRWRRSVMDIDEVRRSYARQIGSRLNIQCERLIDALAKVPREQFLGPGPWAVSAGVSGHVTEETDARHLYQDVSVAIHAERNLYNGSPGIVAKWLEAADIDTGDRVYHVGCGMGYYTAILAEMAGPGGNVVAIEVDDGLALQAKRNLAHLSNVEVLAGDGSRYDPAECDVIFVHAGVTHPGSVWLDRLRPGGTIVLPLTFDFSKANVGKGAVLVIRRTGSSFAARFLPQPVAIFSCTGMRDDELNEKLLNGFKAGWVETVRSLRRDVHEPDATCCFHAERFGFCLSRLMSGSGGQ